MLVFSTSKKKPQKNLPQKKYRETGSYSLKLHICLKMLVFFINLCRISIHPIIYQGTGGTPGDAALHMVGAKLDGGTSGSGGRIAPGLGPGRGAKIGEGPIRMERKSSHPLYNRESAYNWVDDHPLWLFR